MTTAKLHIDLSRGHAEVEGEEAFVREVYKDFKERLGKQGISAAQLSHGGAAKHHERKGEVKPARGKGKGKGKGDSDGKLDKTLDLSGVDGKPSLKQYLKGFNAKTLPQKNTVFIAYLRDQLGIAKINVDHIYTCFDDVGPLPGALRQSLRDASYIGPIDFSDADDIKLAV